MALQQELAGASRRKGRVVDFDEHRGLGRIRSEGGEDLLFHCVELSDGTRRIEVGTAVEFEVRVKFSRPEAFAIRSTPE